MPLRKGVNIEKGAVKLQILPLEEVKIHSHPLSCCFNPQADTFSLSFSARLGSRRPCRVLPVYRQEDLPFSEDRTGGVPCKPLTCLSLWPASFLRKQGRIWILIQKFLKGWPPSGRAWGFFTVIEEIPWIGEVMRTLSLLGTTTPRNLYQSLFTCELLCVFRTPLSSRLSTSAQILLVSLGPETLATSFLLPNTSIYSSFERMYWVLTTFGIHNKQNTHGLCLSEPSSKWRLI